MPLLVRAFTAEIEICFIAATKENKPRCKLASVEDGCTSSWSGTAPGVTFMEARVKEHVRLLPEKTEKRLKCLD